MDGIHPPEVGWQFQFQVYTQPLLLGLTGNLTDSQCAHKIIGICCVVKNIYIPFPLHWRTLSAFKLFFIVLQRSLVLLSEKVSSLHLTEFASSSHLAACLPANLHQGSPQHLARNLAENFLLLSQAACSLKIQSSFLPFSFTLLQIREFSREFGKSRNISVQLVLLLCSEHGTSDGGVESLGCCISLNLSIVFGRISSSCVLAFKRAEMLEVK